MVKSLYSGVAGLKSQQTKMDVIGNNIANVGTYGYKSSRATFKDVYYQTQTAATAATGNIGGTNAKQVGYGNSVSSIDTNTQTSAMSATGYNLDIAIAGEGFLQVMGMDGKIMYTKAGMLDIDAEGNLVDVNGNFILGSAGDVSAPPASEKINISLPFLDPSISGVKETINDITYEIKSSNFTNKANVSFTFAASSSMPVGQKMVAKVTGSAINVTLNSNEYIRDMNEFNSLLNQAITDSLGGVEHPAGAFTITASDESKFQNPLSPRDENGELLGLTGAEIVSNNFGFNLGEAGYIKNDLTSEHAANTIKNLFSIKTVNSGFQADTRIVTNQLDKDGISDDDDDNPANVSFVYGTDGIKVIVRSDNYVDPITHEAGNDTAEYVGIITYDKLNAPGEVILRRRDTSNVKAEEAAIEQKKQVLKDKEKDLDSAVKSDTTIKEASKAEAQTRKDLTDKINEFVKDSTIQGLITGGNSEIGKIWSGGNIISPLPENVKLGLSDADLNNDSNLIAMRKAIEELSVAYGKANTNLTSAINNYNTANPTATLNVSDVKTVADPYYVALKDYEDAKATYAKAEVKYDGDETDSIVVNYPDITSIRNAMKALGIEGYEKIADIDAYRNNPSSVPGGDPGAVVLDCGDILKLRHSEPTRSLGLGQKSFNLSGGTEGGEQTVANLTGISINSDGVIVGVHEVYGVCELGRVDLATFANPAGLTKVGSTYFETSLNSGEPIIVNAGTEGTGEIMASTLEASNVDLSSEFSDMIMTQRGFQASSRVITVSDTMLEELINLKR